MKCLILIGHHYLKESHPNQSQHLDHATGDLQYVFINIQVYISIYDLVNRMQVNK